MFDCDIADCAARAEFLVYTECYIGCDHPSITITACDTHVASALHAADNSDCKGTVGISIYHYNEED